MIIKTVSLDDFVNEIYSYEIYRYKFTQAGLVALYDYLDNLSEDLNEPIELDVVSLCCDYTEYESIEEFKDAYPNFEKYTDDETFWERLSDFTIVIPVDNAMKTDNFIIVNF